MPTSRRRRQRRCRPPTRHCAVRSGTSRSTKPTTSGRWDIFESGWGGRPSSIRLRCRRSVGRGTDDGDGRRGTDDGGPKPALLLPRGADQRIVDPSPVSRLPSPVSRLPLPRPFMSEHRFRSLAETRWRIAVSLTAMMVAIYFGFILLIAYDKPLMGRLLTRGLSVGVLLGALVIVLSWVLTWVYVRWANTHYEAGREELRRGEAAR